MVILPCIFNSSIHGIPSLPTEQFYLWYLILVFRTALSVENALLLKPLSDPYQSRYNSIFRVGLQGIRTNKFNDTLLSIRTWLYLYQCSIPLSILGEPLELWSVQQYFNMNVNPETNVSVFFGIWSYQINWNPLAGLRGI